MSDHDTASDIANDIAHDHHGHAHPPAREDDDVALTADEAKFLALKAILIEKGLVTPDEIRARMEQDESHTWHQGARMIARAWIDSAYRERMVADGKAAAIELGIPVTEAAIVTVENTPERHNLIVCTLCSCYPRSLLGEPPSWYVSKAYRSRAVREPRKVLKEFGLAVPDDVEVRVHDSNADMRYIVLPMRPAGTEGMSEEALSGLVTRDCLVGAALPRVPQA
ncbi:MAG TPA: nitrile hydratase subunit alpha [Afifellaceae bacterium]|nr:nitrile hydratase subunit alpha [Afifellaceae bacterium]